MMLLLAKGKVYSALRSAHVRCRRPPPRCRHQAASARLQQALARLWELWGAAPGTPEGDELEGLMDQVEELERRFDGAR